MSTQSVERNMLRWAKYRARKKGIEFELTLEDINIPDRCPVLGIELNTSAGRASDFSPSLDRIDPSKGYVRGNIRVVSYRANRLKSDAKVIELLAIASYYSTYL